MKILALDSTAPTATAAICDGTRLLGEYTINNSSTHSEILLPMIEALLGVFGLSADDIDIFACSAGPGSFTGVRIGAATVKGLAFSTGKPCVGVSSLEALARNLDGAHCIACPVMNARRGQVYNALFDCDGGLPRRLTDDRAISVAELGAELKEYSKPVILCGDGIEVTLAGGVAASPAPEKLKYPSAYSVAQCALSLYDGGIRTTDIELTPVYLRMPQAERERLAKISGSIEANERLMKK